LRLVAGPAARRCLPDAGRRGGPDEHGRVGPRRRPHGGPRATGAVAPQHGAALEPARLRDLGGHRGGEEGLRRDGADAAVKPLDVAVVGGGPAGAATALCLARTGRSVALLERADAPGFHAGETLAPEVRSPLAQLGVWDRFVADHHRSTHSLWSAWGASGVSAKDLL